MTQVKEFCFHVGGDTRETIIRAYSIDQAKRLLREALGVTRLPAKTVLVSSAPSTETVDDLSLVWEKEEVAVKKKEKKELKDSGRLVTVFLFTMKDGTVHEIVETAETRAKVLLREKLNVARLPSGIISQKVEKVAPMKKLERELARKSA